MLSLKTHVCRSNAAAFRVVDGVAMILNPGESKFYALNDVGTKIWELADGTHNVNKIVEMICAHFDVERAQATMDTTEFIEKLSNKGLLVFPTPASEEE